MRRICWIALLAELCWGCGGSSSETPPPLEPDPRRLQAPPAAQVGPLEPPPEAAPAPAPELEPAPGSADGAEFGIEPLPSAAPAVPAPLGAPDGGTSEPAAKPQPKSKRPAPPP